MMPSTAMGGAPKRTAPRPVPVGWLEEPETLGILRAERTKAYAPIMARSKMVFRCSATIFRMAIRPHTRKGRQMAPQAMAWTGGR